MSDIPIMIANSSDCAICGKHVMAGYAVHHQCAGDLLRERMYTAKDIVPFKFPPYQEMVELIAFKEPNLASVRSKGCYVTIHFSKKRKELVAVFFSTRCGFPAGSRIEPNTPEGYQRICDYAIKRKYEVAISFIE